MLEIVSKLVARNSELERRLAEIRSPRRANEGVSSAQLALLLEGLANSGDAVRDEADQKLRKTAEQAAPEPRGGTPPPRQPPLRRPLPPGLRRIPNELVVPSGERGCPRCSKDRRCIGHDVTEVLDLIPAEVIVRVDSREKLACEDCEAEVVRAPLGDKVVAGGRMGCALVANLLVEKYRDGLPLHRQRDRFERLGTELPVSTLADQVTWATESLAPVVRAAKERTLEAKFMHIDGTGLPVLDRDAKTNKRVGSGKRIGSLWGCVGDDSAFYFYASTGKKLGQRAGEIGPEDLLKLRKAYTVADAATMFDKSFAREDIIECGCNMHARRKLVAALESGDTRASLPVSAFKVLGRQKNVWAVFGSGSAPIEWYRAICVALKVRRPYARLVITLSLLFWPSTAPLEMAPRASNQFMMRAWWLRMVLANFCTGGILERSARVIQAVRNFVAEAAEVCSHRSWRSSSSR